MIFLIAYIAYFANVLVSRRGLSVFGSHNLPITAIFTWCHVFADALLWAFHSVSSFVYRLIFLRVCNTRIIDWKLQITLRFIFFELYAFIIVTYSWVFHHVALVSVRCDHRTSSFDNQLVSTTYLEEQAGPKDLEVS